jgi:hypothetical protein
MDVEAANSQSSGASMVSLAAAPARMAACRTDWAMVGQILQLTVVEQVWG